MFTVSSEDLKAAREATGISLSAMARRLHYTKGYLSQIENGKKPIPVGIKEQYLAVCIDLLDPIRRAETIGRADLQRRSFVVGAAFSSLLAALPLKDRERVQSIAAYTSDRKAGLREVEAVRAMTNQLVAMDETMGGGIGRETVAAFLSSDVAELLKGRFVSEDIRRQAYGAAAEVAYLAGWKAHDMGLDGLTQRYYLTAYELAKESGDPGHQAFTLRIQALQGCDVGESEFSPRLAEEAMKKVKGRIGVDTEDLFRVCVARCYAETGDRRKALEALRGTRALHPDSVSEIPRYAALWSPNKATLLNQTSRTFKAMGDTEMEVEMYRQVIDLWDHDTKSRPWALAVTDLGDALWRLGDEGEAAEQWAKAWPVLKGMRSKRAGKAMKRISDKVPDLAG